MLQLNHASQSREPGVAAPTLQMKCAKERKSSCLLEAVCGPVVMPSSVKPTAIGPIDPDSRMEEFPRVPECFGNWAKMFGVG